MISGTGSEPELPATAIDFTSEIIDVLLRERAIRCIAIEVNPSLGRGNDFFNQFHNNEFVDVGCGLSTQSACLFDNCR